MIALTLTMADSDDTSQQPATNGRASSAAVAEPPRDGRERVVDGGASSASIDSDAGEDVELHSGDHVRNGTLVERERRRDGFFLRWLKRLAALLLILLVLLLLALGGISLALRSTLPKSIATDVATGLLGLDVGLGDLDIGWGGDVTLTDLTLRLPSDDGEGEKLLEVPRVAAQLSALPLVAFEYLTTGLPALKNVEVERPTVYATQRDDGSWNLVDAATVAASNLGGGGDPDAPPGPPKLPPLPDLSLVGGKVVVTNAEGETATLGEITLKGDKKNALVYTADGGVGDVAQVTARLLPSGGLRQNATLAVDNLADALSPVFDLPEASLDAEWEGGFAGDGTLDGTLTLNSARVGDIRVAKAAPAPSTQPTTRRSPADSDDRGPVPAGKIDVSFADGVLTARPRDIVVRDLPGVTGRATLVNGVARVGDGTAAVSDILLRVFDGEVLVESASLDLEQLTGSFAARFRDLKPQDAADLTGTAGGHLEYGPYGEPRGKLEVDAYGTVAGTGLQHLSAEVRVDGKNYRDFTTLDIVGELRDAPLVLGATEQSILLPKATATVAVRLAEDEPQRRIELVEIRSLNPDLVRLSGQGAYYPTANAEWEEGAFWLWLEERGFPVPVPRVAERVPLDLGIEISGVYDPASPGEGAEQTVKIDNLYGSLADVQIAGNGWWINKRPPEEGGVPDPPLYLLLTLTRDGELLAPPTPGGRAVLMAQRALRDDGEVAEENEQALADATGDEGKATNDDAEDEQIAAARPVRGTITTWLYVTGDPTVPDLKAVGDLTTDGLAVGEYEIGSLNTKITAAVTGERLTIRTPRDPAEQASLLGARISLDADVPFDEAQAGELHLEIANLGLRQVSAAAALPTQFSGTLDGRLDATLRGLDPNNVRAAGEFVVTNLATPDVYLADTLTVEPSLSDGVLNVPITLKQRFATAPGPTFVGEDRELSLQAVYDLRRPDVIEILNVEGEGYPLVLTPDTLGVDLYAAAQLSAKAPSLTIDLDGPDGTAEGLPTIAGRLVASAKVDAGPRRFALEPLLNGKLEALATQSQVTLEELSADLPGVGDIKGEGTLSLTDLPGRSKILVYGRDLDLAAVGRKLRLPEGAAGTADFSLTVQPAPGERPKGEVMVNASLSGSDARWNSVTFERGQAILYLSRVGLDNQRAGGQYDFTLLTSERIYVQAAGGRAEGYVRVRDRGDGVLFLQSSLTVDGMALDQIAPVIDQDASGAVSLEANVFGDLNQQAPAEARAFDATTAAAAADAETAVGVTLPPVTAEVNLRVREGNLRPIRVFTAILSQIKVLPAPERDTLDLEFRLEQGDVQVSSFRALVAGAEIRGSGNVRDVLSGEAARLDLAVVALARPLGAFQLPFSDALDEALAAIQSQASALDVRGTLGKPIIIPKTAGEVGSALKVLFGGGQRGPEE